MGNILRFICNFYHRLKYRISFIKTIGLLILIFVIFCNAKCEKDNLDSNDLPPATQSGKNTLGFLLNGQPWTPQGSRVTANLSIDFYPNFNNGIFNIVAYNFIPMISEQFTIGMRDSLNFMNSPFTLNLDSNSLYVISFTMICDYFISINDVVSSRSLMITKLDRVNKIISGTFSANLRPGCDIVRITDGCFDMKY